MERWQRQELHLTGRTKQVKIKVPSRMRISSGTVTGLEGGHRRIKHAVAGSDGDAERNQQLLAPRHMFNNKSWLG